jgi:hypothetical protein
MRDRTDYRKFRADAEYEAWRRGIDPGDLDDEDLRDGHLLGRLPEECVQDHLKRRRKKRERA